MPRARTAALVAIVAIVATACGGGGGSDQSADETTSTLAPVTTAAPPTTTAAASPNDVYANTHAGMLAPSVQDITPRVYVPNGHAATVTVIDPTTFTITDTFPVGALPQHVVPSYDMQTLYVNNNQGNSLTPIDPRTGAPGAAIPVDDPYNLYFSPDGKYALVMAERERRIDVRDPTTWELVTSISVPQAGVNHADFTADGATMIASCEFSGFVVRIDLATFQVTGELEVGGEPIDVRISPDGSVFYVANHVKNGGGVSVVDPATMTETSFIPTAAGAHGLYPSRDATQLYVTNRAAGSVTVLDFATGAPVTTWTIDGGGSPDMGGVSADGTQFWVSGRYDDVVYVFDTATGGLLAKIPVGHGPHGLAIFPQPGKISLGHTGNYR
ncbi:MAG: cytochrome D1 domain-containing protein [Acidimicrobiia bacterium]